jgi:cytochrome c-type biogenesis protein
MATDVIALFGAGVASCLAPCIVPLLPAYVGMVAADARRTVPATVVFVLGFAAVFAGLGVAAGAVGSSLTDLQDGLQRGGGVVVALMGLVLLGALRGPFARERRLLQGERLSRVGGRLGPARPFMIGVAFGAAWSPCVGPLLGAALVVAAQRGDALRGGLLLTAYALGIGVPFVVASLGLASSPGALAWLRRVSRPLELVAGGALLALGLLLATGLYGDATSYLARFTPSVGGL